MNEIKMTIFTPTYNRAYILPRLYESLCSQTNKDFEWLIVDDGSEDETQEIVQKWIEDAKIDIRYYKQKNGGKQRAHNVGVEKSNGKLFVCVDSDDYVTSEFIEEHLRGAEKIKNDPTVAGIVSLKSFEDGQLVGTCFPKGVEYATLTDLYGKYKFQGDTALMYYTAILKKFPFVVEEDEKFIGEGYVYSQIDREYRMYLMPKTLLICEYLQDGYSKNVRKITKENPKSYAKLKKQAIEFSISWKERYIQTILYMVGCRMAKQSQIKEAPYKMLAVLGYAPAWLVWKIFYKDA